MYRSFLLLFLVTNLVGCSGDVTQEKPQESSNLKEHLVEANRLFVESQAADIDAYLARHHLKMSTSGTGLRYHLIKRTENVTYPVPGDTVSIDYEVMLLDGTPCYKTSGSPIDFVVGKAEMPNGMEEAISMMSPGDSGIVILPSHLAYGFTGDGDKIPGNQVTIYYLSLMDLKKSKLIKTQ